MTHLRPDVIKVFTASKGKEILRPPTVGSTEVVATFSIPVNSVLVLNNGPNEVYIDFNETVTVATGALIPAKAWWSGNVPITALHFICAVGQTATVNITGFVLA